MRGVTGLASIAAAKGGTPSLLGCTLGVDLREEGGFVQGWVEGGGWASRTGELLILILYGIRRLPKVDGNGEGSKGWERLILEGEDPMLGYVGQNT